MGELEDEKPKVYGGRARIRRPDGDVRLPSQRPTAKPEAPTPELRLVRAEHRKEQPARTIRRRRQQALAKKFSDGEGQKANKPSEGWTYTGRCPRCVTGQMYRLAKQDLPNTLGCLQCGHRVAVRLA